MTDSSHVREQRINMAIAAIKAGDSAQARTLLEHAITDDPDNDRAWQWLAVVAKDADEQHRCLYRALSINPNNQAVRQALQQLSADTTLVPASPTLPVPVPTVLQPIVYYDQPSPHRFSSYLLATLLFCVTSMGFTLVVVGSFLPWVRVEGVEMAALEREGFLTLTTGVVGILTAAIGIWRSGCLSLLSSVASISCALVAIGVSAYDVFSVADAQVSLGWGFILVLLGGLIAMLSSVANSFSGLTMLSSAMRK